MDFIILKNISLVEFVLLMTLAVSFFALLFYYMLVFFPVVKSRLSKKTMISEPNPPLSVVVIINDDIDFLQNRAEHLLSQQIDSPYQVVIVDDTSYLDQTQELLAQLKEKYNNLYVTSIPYSGTYRHTKKLAYTIGVKAAKYDNILFLSSDVDVCESTWAQKMVKGFEYGNIVNGYCRIKRGKGLVNRVARCRNVFQSLLSMGKCVKSNPYHLNENIFGFTREIFSQSNGYAAYTRLNRGENDLVIQSLPKKVEKNTSLLFGRVSTVEKEVDVSFREYYKEEAFQIYSHRYYKTAVRLYLLLYNVVNILFWVSSLALLFTHKIELISIAGGVILLKLLLLFLILFLFSRRTMEKIPYLYACFYDIYAPFESLCISMKNKFSPRKDIWI